MKSVGLCIFCRQRREKLDHGVSFTQLNFTWPRRTESAGLLSVPFVHCTAFNVGPLFSVLLRIQCCYFSLRHLKFVIILNCTCLIRHWGKIQGDGQKFLDHFKSYFGSQISSQSLNKVHIYWLQPKSGTKGDFFHIFLSLIVSSRRYGL